MQCVTTRLTIRFDINTAQSVCGTFTPAHHRTKYLLRKQRNIIKSRSRLLTNFHDTHINTADYRVCGRCQSHQFSRPNHLLAFLRTAYKILQSVPVHDNKLIYSHIYTTLPFLFMKMFYASWMEYSRSNRSVKKS